MVLQVEQHALKGSQLDELVGYLAVNFAGNLGLGVHKDRLDVPQDANCFRLTTIAYHLTVHVLYLNLSPQVLITFTFLTVEVE